MKRHIFIFFETLVIFLLALVVSYFINPQDPLFVKNLGINIYLFTLIVITLFYGIWYGLLGVVVLYIFLLYYYLKVDYNFFLVHVLFMLVSAVFHFIYTRKIEVLNEEKYFFNDKYNSLAKNFYLLKVAYENLEKNYLLKPFSVRDVLKDIRNYVLLDYDEAVSKLFSFIVETFSIEEGNLYVNKKGTFKQVQFIGYPLELDLKDELVRLAVERKEIVFISDPMDYRKTKHIAVIPVVDEKDNIISILTINNMPFVKFNMDNILTISLFLSYFFHDINMKDYVQKFESAFCDFDFHKELYKLSLLRKKYKKESTVVVIDILNPDIKEQVNEIINKISRSTDIYCIEKLILVILPLTSISGAESYINRVKTYIANRYPSEYVENINFSVVPVRNTYDETIKDLQEFLK